MGLISFAATDIGAFRTTNEDSFFSDDEIGLYVVADGMGGHAAGEVASNEAIDAIASVMLKERVALLGMRAAGAVDDASRERIKRLLESSIQSAAYLVHSIAQMDLGKVGMGTTISALLLVGGHGFTGQVGDSRVYRCRGGKVTQLTEDHTLVQWQVKEGLMTSEEAAEAVNRNVVTRAVGSKDYVQVDVHFFPVEPSDVFMLCSDGLHEYVDAQEIGEVLQMDPEAAVRRFLEAASNRGGKDNITGIAVKQV